MYQTLDGEFACESCTRRQCDGEIPDGAVWVDGGECYLCERNFAALVEENRTPPAPIAAERFAHALDVLPPRRWIRRDGVQTFHISERIVGNVVAIYCKVGDRYWRMQDFATLGHDEIVQRCLTAEHCPHCHDDPAGCAECPHCPHCGDPMRDHDDAYCAEQNQGVL